MFEKIFLLFNYMLDLLFVVFINLFVKHLGFSQGKPLLLFFVC